MVHGPHFKMLSQLLPLALLLLCCCAYFAEGNSSRNDKVAILSPTTQTSWGNWGPWQYCGAGEYVDKFEARIEGYLGNGDDTALNAVKFFCKPKYGYTWSTSITSATGPWGTELRRSCPSGFFNAIQVRSQSWQRGGDDTAANDVKFRCGNGPWISIGGTKWGTWGSTEYCPSGSAICGIRTKVEGYQGSGDDTALNAIQVACCRL